MLPTLLNVSLKTGTKLWLKVKGVSLYIMQEGEITGFLIVHK